MENEPKKELTLWEEAGMYADKYRGEGWMRLRSLLVSFHLDMLKKERCNQLQKDEKKI
jgi:hypothetical protein